MRHIKLWFHQVSLSFISGGTLAGCEWGSYGRPHPTSGVWTASQPWTPSFGITTTPSHGQRRRSSAGLSVTLVNSPIFTDCFFPVVLVDYLVESSTVDIFTLWTVSQKWGICLSAITLNWNRIQTNMAVYVPFTVSSIIILYRGFCFYFTWAILQYVCVVTVSAPAPPEICESFQLFVSKAKLRQIWCNVFLTWNIHCLLFLFSQFLSVIFMQLVVSNPSLSFDRGLWFVGSWWLINSTSTRQRLSVIRVRLKAEVPDILMTISLICLSFHNFLRDILEPIVGAFLSFPQSCAVCLDKTC